MPTNTQIARKMVCHKIAFTLAEILITLGIIGIVAALTVPSLIAKYQQKVTVNRLKSNYSILSQAINDSKLDHGDIATWDFSLNSVEFAEKYILPYLKVSQTLSGLNKAWRLNVLGEGGKRGHIYAAWSHNNNERIYILTNGAGISIKHFLDLRMEIVVDINGSQGPNEMGVDGFVFYINKNTQGLTPVMLQHDRDTLINNQAYGCNRETPITTYYRGAWCTALIVKDNWQVGPDYPW